MASPSDILIFGGTGFLGRHLCEYLAAKNLGATIISRNPDCAFLDDLSGNFIAKSLDELHSTAREIFSQAKTLIYLASTTLPATNHGRPWLEISQSVEPALRIFTLASSINPLIRILFSSSGGTVYGGSHSGPITEDQPLKPTSAYGLGKVMLEEGLRFLGRSQGTRYAVIRLSNPVGRWQINSSHGIVNVAIQRTLAGEPITLYGGGRQWRDFLDADDVAAAIFAILQSDRWDGSVWNVGSGVGHSVTDVLDMLESLMGIRIMRKFESDRAFDIPWVVLDAGKIFKEIGWRAETTFKRSLEKILASHGLLAPTFYLSD